MDSTDRPQRSPSKERRLQRRREREHANRASETAAQKEERLRKRRMRDRAKREAETEEQRMARLQRKHTRESDRLAAETPDQREARLDRQRVTVVKWCRELELFSIMNDKFKVHTNRGVFSTALHVHVNHYQNNTDVSEGSPLRCPTSH